MSEPSTRDFLRFVFYLAMGTAPFYALAVALPGRGLVPGVSLSVFSVIVPTVAAACAARRSQIVTWPALLREAASLRLGPLKRWYGLALVLYPVVLVVNALLRSATGEKLPPLDWAPGMMTAVTAFSVVAGVLEEIGWAGFATRVLRTTHGPIFTALVVGAVWTLWHWLPLAQLGRSAAWIAWWSLYSLAARAVLLWLFERTGGSVAVSALFHATLNIGWQAYPVQGSAWDPRTVSLLMCAVAVGMPWATPRRLRSEG
jgi:uncharacterized protein